MEISLSNKFDKDKFDKSSVLPNIKNIGHLYNNDHYKTFTFFYDPNTKYVLLNEQNITNQEKLKIPSSGEDIKLSLVKYSLENSPEGGYTKRSVKEMLYKHRATIFINIPDVATMTVGELCKIMKELIDISLKYEELSNETIITTQSGIKIENKEDKIELSDGKIKIDLQDKLKEYFSNDLNHNAIVKFIGGHVDNKDLRVVDKIVKNVDDLTAKDPILGRLKDNKILRVYAVLKGDTGKESVLFGLAKNLKRTGNFSGSPM